MLTRCLVAALLIGLLPGCDSDGDAGGDTLQVPATYTFPSSLLADVDSVSYTGQTARHVLIHDLNAYIGGLDAAIDGGAFAPASDGDVVAALDFYYRFDSDSDGGVAHTVTGAMPITPATHGAISTGKDLAGKFAGNDAASDHRKWTAGDFRGWSDGGIAVHGGATSSPEGLLTAFFQTLEEAAIDRANGTIAKDPGGSDLPVYVTAEGLDLQQLIQKFLLMSVTFSQGLDDYLDDDIDDKGLLSSNVAESGAAYTPLQHAWDEAFGYFGAARDYADYTDDELASAGGRADWQGMFDTDGDGAIDVRSELNFGASVNAAKRDRGSVVATDFTGDVFQAFLRGRALIGSFGDTVTSDEIALLRAERDAIRAGWEGAIAATVVHYINAVLVDMAAFGTADYAFTDHAKHWSELKGFALGLQYNPASPMLGAFEAFHALVGDAPVLATADAAAIASYRADLVAARDMLQVAYGFDAANTGDGDGQGGW